MVRLAALVAVALLLPQAALAAAPPGYISETLPNGLRVSVLPDPANPVVATQVWYHVGSADEDAGSRGLAHLFEHLMFGETTTRPAKEYWEYHHRAGGTNNAWTSEDETVYVSEIAPAYHMGVLEREADRMANLVLSEENLRNEQRIVTEELRRATENDPMSRVFTAARKALLGTHPYALSPVGTKEDIGRATVASCKAFYSRYYRPSNAHLVVVGPVDPQATLEAVRRLFGPIPGAEVRHTEAPLLLRWPFPPEIAVEEDLPPAEVALLVFPLPPPDSDDHDAVDVLLRMIAGGQYQPFREELVTRRGKAVEGGTVTFDMRRGRLVAFYGAYLPYRRKETAFHLLEETRETLSRMGWLTEEALAGAKRSILRGELGRVYSSSSRAGAIGRALWDEGDEARAFDRAERIGRVTLPEVREAYRRYIGDARPVRVWVEPTHVPVLVRLFGWLYPLIQR